MNRAVSSHIDSLAQITTFLLHRTLLHPIACICQGWLVENVERSQVWSPWKKDGETVNDHPVCSDFSFFYIFCVYENLLWIVFSHPQCCEWSCGNWGRNWAHLFRSLTLTVMTLLKSSGWQKGILDVSDAPFCDFLCSLYLCCSFIGFDPMHRCCMFCFPWQDQDKRDKCHNQILK